MVYVVPEKRLFFWKLEQIKVEEYHPRCGYNKNCRSFQRILQYWWENVYYYTGAPDVSMLSPPFIAIYTAWWSVEFKVLFTRKASRKNFKCCPMSLRGLNGYFFAQNSEKNLFFFWVKIWVENHLFATKFDSRKKCVFGTKHDMWQ